MKEHEDRLVLAVERVAEELHVLHQSVNNQTILQRIEQKVDIMAATIADAFAALTALSTASDGVSVKLDKLIADTEALIASLGSVALTPAQEAAVTAAQASIATATAAGDKVDAEVAKADGVLPKPAPAGA
jgi:hypothetical protein